MASLSSERCWKSHAWARWRWNCSRYQPSALCAQIQLQRPPARSRGRIPSTRGRVSRRAWSIFRRHLRQESTGLIPHTIYRHRLHLVCQTQIPWPTRWWARSHQHSRIVLVCWNGAWSNCFATVLIWNHQHGLGSMGAGYLFQPTQAFWGRRNICHWWRVWGWAWTLPQGNLVA